MADWIPTREQDLIDVCGRWTTALTDSAKISAYDWDLVTCAAVLSAITAFVEARTNYEADNSTAHRLAKIEAKDAAVQMMRDFANSSIRFNKKMPDAEKLLFGIKPADKTPTPHGTPASQPDTVVENSVNHYEHRIKAINHATGNAKKPADAYGVRYGWQVGGEQPVSGADLPKSKFSRKTSLTVTHTEADKGKPAYYASCYENARGDAGPWSPVEEAFIG